MYLVTLRERPDSEPIVIHSPFGDGVKLVSGSINQGVNSIDSFDLEIDFSNAGYGHIKPMQSLIDVRNVKNNYVEFSGRLVNYVDSMSSDGSHSKTAVCEGALGYLHDSSQPYIDYTGTAEGLFTQLITNHNSQVEDYKQFKMGTISLKTKLDKSGSIVSVDNAIPTTSTTAFITPEQTTFEIVKASLLDVFGGEIQVRNVGSSVYIDYVLSVGHDSKEPVSINRNLRGITKKVDPSSIVTRLMPLGKTISTEDQNDNERRLTIESVNSGLMYIERQDLKSEFGIQTGNVIFDDVTDPTILKSKGVDWLNTQKVVLQQFTVDALDLFKIGKGVEEYIVGNTHKVINPIMSLNEWIRIIGKKVDIVDPVNSSLTIGDKFKTLIDYQKEQRINSKNITIIQRNLNDQKIKVNTLDGQISGVNESLADKETVSGAQSKADAAVVSANSYTDSKFTNTVKIPTLLNGTTAYDVDRTPKLIITPNGERRLTGTITGAPHTATLEIMQLDVTDAPNKTIAFAVALSASSGGGYGTVSVTASGKVIVDYTSNNGDYCCLDGVSWIPGI